MNAKHSVARFKLNADNIYELNYILADAEMIDQ